MQFVVIFALIVSIFAVIFALQNPNSVVLNLIFWQYDQPLAIYLLISMVLGAILVSLLTIPGWIRNKSDKKRNRKGFSELEDNLAKYRNDLIDAQNSNKDLRLKVSEIEEDKINLEKALAKTQEEVYALNAALSDALLAAKNAEQAKNEALEARNSIDSALMLPGTKPMEFENSSEKPSEVAVQDLRDSAYFSEHNPVNYGAEDENAGSEKDGAMSPALGYQYPPEPHDMDKAKKKSWFS